MTASVSLRTLGPHNVYTKKGRCYHALPEKGEPSEIDGTDNLESIVSSLSLRASYVQESFSWKKSPENLEKYFRLVKTRKSFEPKYTMLAMDIIKPQHKKEI